MPVVHHGDIVCACACGAPIRALLDMDAELDIPKPGDRCGKCQRAAWQRMFDEMRGAKTFAATVGRKSCGACSGTGIAYEHPCTPCWTAEIKRLREREGER